MRVPFILSSLLLLLPLLAPAAVAQETPPSVVAAYDALADTILSVRRAEDKLVRSILAGHRHAAQALLAQGDWEGVAAQIALFANEGDNAVAGVRKRLVEGGHHHNAAGEEQGIYEQGYVVITRETKAKLLGLSTAIRRAEDDAARQKAWSAFVVAADQVLASP